MDGRKFDQLTKVLAEGATRRRFIKGIVGGAAGALAGVFGTKRVETVLAAPLCPGGGGPDNKICHCPPGQDGGNCQTTGNGSGHDGPGHEFDCCCLAGGSPNPLCICPSGTSDCCKPAGTTCASNANCCADAPNCCNGICQVGPCNRCIGVTCTASDQCHDVGVCDPATGICSNPPKADGTTCETGNLCTADTCQAGICTQGAPSVTCTASDQCHDVGTCDPVTGVCSNPAKADGTTCETGNLCTADTCVAGICTEGAPSVTCTASDQCHDVGTCDPATGVCSDPAKADGIACETGNLCTADTCVAGICTEGSPSVTCTASDQCHDVGTCNPATGACSNPAKADGTTCETGNLCTADTCQAGICTEGDVSVTCTASDQCHDVGTCDPATGICSDPPKTDGTTCETGNLCTADTCVAGICTEGPPAVTCSASDQCHDVGVCDPATGVCSDPAKADGTTCETGNRCTADTCQAGICTQGSLSVTCSSEDPCLVSTCDPATGSCVITNAPDGTACNDGNACTQTDTCTAGVCVGSNPVVCTASDQCHDVGTCDPATGTCSNPIKPVGTPCNDGSGATCGETCQADGTCGGGAICGCTDAESPKRCIKGGPEFTCKRCAGVTQGSVQVVCDRSNNPSCVCASKTCTVNGQTIAKGQPVPACSAVTCDARPPA